MSVVSGKSIQEVFTPTKDAKNMLVCFKIIITLFLTENAGDLKCYRCKLVVLIITFLFKLLFLFLRDLGSFPV